MVSLKEITEENFNKVIELEVCDTQKNFVARNIYSLAQAWLYYKNAYPFAIYNDDIMVGFLMLGSDWDRDGSDKSYGLWRLMIDKKYQGQGYGKQAVQVLIDYVKQNFNPETFVTSVVPGNEAAEKLYASLGFTPNGEYDDDEKVMVLSLKDCE